MSVIMSLRMKGDGQKLEQLAKDDSNRLPPILEQAKQAGLIAHRFYGNDSGDILVVDEWPDAESFQRFFEGAQEQIGSLMQDVGVTEQPQPEFWNKLETGDEYGWES